eukprot:GHVT01093120.1.p1 GENE.GHVT01093120.1~~GHVT01093120.1.p1  ORF type:complete len:224 (+),score=12.89 GHVT01093120.1:444-1115(+)
MDDDRNHDHPRSTRLRKVHRRGNRSGPRPDPIERRTFSQVLSTMRATFNRIQDLRERGTLLFKDGVYCIAPDPLNTGTAVSPPTHVLRRLWTDEIDARLFKAMNAAQSTIPEHVMRTGPLPDRTCAQVAARIEHLGNRIQVEKDGKHSLEPEIVEVTRSGPWTRDEIRLLQRALNLTENGTLLEVKATGLLGRSGEQIQKKLKHLQDKPLLVKDGDGYRITEP